MRAEIAESGLDREKSHAPRQAHFARFIFFFFFSRSSGVQVQTVKTLPVYPGASYIQHESPGLPYGSPLNIFSGINVWNICRCIFSG